MGTYYIPRNYKGETRILYIFTTKSLITTAIGAGGGSIFFFILTAVGLKMPGIIAMAAYQLLKKLVVSQYLKLLLDILSINKIEKYILIHQLKQKREVNNHDKYDSYT